MSIIPLTFPPKILAAPLSSTGTRLILPDIEHWDGNDLTSGEVGTVIYASIMDFNKTIMEIVELDPSTLSVATTTGILINKRGLSFMGGTVAAAETQYPWTANESFVLLGSNPPQILVDLVDLDSAQTITGVKTFTGRPALTTDADTAVNEELVSFGQLYRTSLAGAVDADETHNGLVEIATEAQIDADTETGEEGTLAVNPKNLATSKYGTRLPTAGEKLALAGTLGTPTTDNEYITDADSTGVPLDGTISLFADAGAGQVTVTSTAHGLRDGQSVVITNTVNHNGTFTVAGATTNTFEITDTWVDETITVFADAGGGQVTVTSAGHGLANGRYVTISGTTNYNGRYVVAGVTTDTFEITETWNGDDATGVWNDSSGYFFLNISDMVVREGLLNQYTELMFGDGSDGDVTISAPTTLTRDMYYNSLILNEDLNCAGYKIFVKGTLTRNSTHKFTNVGNDGGAGGNGALGVGGVGGAAGATTGSGTTVIKTIGVVGGAGVIHEVAVNPGNAGTAVTNALDASNGSSGGAGGNVTGRVGGAGGAGGASTITTILLKIANIFGMFSSALGVILPYGISGGGGSGGGGGGYRGDVSASGAGGGGGGSASSAGMIFVVAKIIIDNGSGTMFEAIGGVGGDGGDGHSVTGASVGQGAGGGGGAGGNGGILFLVYQLKIGTGTVVVTGGAGGAGGLGNQNTIPAPTLDGVAGTAGSDGTTYEFDLLA